MYALGDSFDLDRLWIRRTFHKLVLGTDLKCWFLQAHLGCLLDMTSHCIKHRQRKLNSTHLRYQISHSGIQARVDMRFVCVNFALLAGELERFHSWILDSDFRDLAAPCSHRFLQKNLKI